MLKYTFYLLSSQEIYKKLLPKICIYRQNTSKTKVFQLYFFLKLKLLINKHL